MDSVFFIVMAMLFAACGFFGVIFGVLMGNEVWLLGGCASFMVLATIPFYVRQEVTGK